MHDTILYILLILFTLLFAAGVTLGILAEK